MTTVHKAIQTTNGVQEQIISNFDCTFQRDVNVGCCVQTFAK